MPSWSYQFVILDMSKGLKTDTRKEMSFSKLKRWLKVSSRGLIMRLVFLQTMSQTTIESELKLIHEGLEAIEEELAEDILQNFP
jgi:hypothetical protein